MNTFGMLLLTLFTILGSAILGWLLRRYFLGGRCGPFGSKQLLKGGGAATLAGAGALATGGAAAAAGGGMSRDVSVSHDDRSAASGAVGGAEAGSTRSSALDANPGGEDSARSAHLLTGSAEAAEDRKSAAADDGAAGGSNAEKSQRSDAAESQDGNSGSADRSPGGSGTWDASGSGSPAGASAAGAAAASVSSVDPQDANASKGASSGAATTGKSTTGGATGTTGGAAEATGSPDTRRGPAPGSTDRSGRADQSSSTATTGAGRSSQVTSQHTDARTAKGEESARPAHLLAGREDVPGEAISAPADGAAADASNTGWQSGAADRSTDGSRAHDGSHRGTTSVPGGAAASGSGTGDADGRARAEASRTGTTVVGQGASPADRESGEAIKPPANRLEVPEAGRAPDDLTAIKGVGPHIQKQLNDQGIYYYDQIAGFSGSDLAWADATLGFKGRVERDDWVGQARDLAKGGGPKGGGAPKRPAAKTPEKGARRSVLADAAGELDSLTGGGAAMSGDESEAMRLIDSGEFVADDSNKPAGLLASPSEGGPDDLKEIKGVGPKLEDLLNSLGIFYFRQIAAFSATDMAWVDSKLRFRGRIVRDRWVQQAKELS